MPLPLVVQGIIETEDGKVFELDSPKGEAWVERIGSFRFEPAGDGKAYTVRRESSGYWYGCRKVAGKVRKKYIGKSSEVSTTRLEEIATALEVRPVSQLNKVAEVAEVVEVVEVAEVVENRLTALELEVADLRKAFETLLEQLPEKSEAGDSDELLRIDDKVAEQLQNDLCNLRADDNEWLRQKLTESQGTVDCLNWGTEALNKQLEALRLENQWLQNELGDSQAEVVELRSQLEAERNSQKEVEAELARLAADREDLAQLKKQAKEHAHELHLEENSMKLEKVRWQRELSDARAELADAKATMLNQGNKIRELERGYSLQPNPAERRLRLEIGELQTQLSDLKQQSVAASKDLPEAADLLNRLKSKRKKSKADLGDLEAVLEILES